MNPSTPAYIELNFCPNVELITVARRFVSEVYGQLLGDPDVSSRIALATHELLENAVKYSLDGATTIRIGILDTEGGARSVSVRTKNRSKPENIAILRRLIDEIAKSPDAFTFYQALMRKNAKRTDGSGLGLARICAEGEMSMCYEISEDEVVIIAQANLGVST